MLQFQLFRFLRLTIFIFLKVFFSPFCKFYAYGHRHCRALHCLPYQASRVWQHSNSNTTATSYSSSQPEQLTISQIVKIVCLDQWKHYHINWWYFLWVFWYKYIVLSTITFMTANHSCFCKIVWMIQI